MPLLNIAFWILIGFIVGWGFHAFQTKELPYIMASDTLPTVSRYPIPSDSNLSRQKKEIVVQTEDEFDQALYRDKPEKLISLYQQAVRINKERAQRMRQQLLGRIFRLIQQKHYSAAQDLLNAYLNFNAYDSEALLLQAQLHDLFGLPLQALENAYDAKIYGQENTNSQQIDLLILKIFSEYEKLLFNQNNWQPLIFLYDLAIKKDVGANQAYYYYKRAQAQFKTGAYHEALASLSQILNHPEWDKKARRLHKMIEKFLAGEGAVAVPVQREEGNKFLVTAVINESIKARMLIDTGASITMLKKSFAVENKLSVAEAEPLLVLTISNVLKTEKVKLSSLGVDGIKLSDINISIAEMPDDFRPDGLLGMDFLGEFEFSLDQEELLLYLFSS